MDHKDAGLQAYLKRYANWDGLKTVAITFDIDWAPDYMTQSALDIIERHGHRTTLYATHDSPLLRKVAAEGRHEVGLHPNLSPNSTQGRNLEEIVGNLRKAYPRADGNRFHILGSSYRDLLWMGTQAFRYDVSRILFNAPYLTPAWHADLNMVVFPYMWEDGVCENQGLTPALDRIALDSPGLKIINFHPMNAYINCAARDDRFAFQKANPDLLNTPEPKAAPFRRTGAGAGKALEDLCKHLQQRGVDAVRVGDLADAYPRRLHGVA